MSKAYKWLALILGVLILLVVGITLFVKFYLTGEVLTAWLTPPLEHYLHRDVRLADAKIGLRGFRIEGLEIRKKDASVPLLKGERLDLRWKFKELFKGKIVIHTLAFSKPEISLIRYEDGSFNISDLLPRKNSSVRAAPSRTRVRSKPSGVPLIISLLAMEDGRLTLVDRSREPQATLQITNVQSSINDLSTVTPVPFQIEGQIEGEGKGSFTINGTFELAKSTLKGNLNLQGIDLTTLNPFFAKGPPDVIQQGNLTLEASLVAEEYDRIKGKGSLNLTGLQIKRDEEISETLEFESGFQLNAAISQQTLSIDALDLTLNGQKAKIQGLITQWDKRPQVNFTLRSPQIKLDELLALLPETPTPSGITEIPPEQGTPQKDPSAESPDVGPGNESPPASASAAPIEQLETASENLQAASDSAIIADQTTETDGEPLAKATNTRTEPKVRSRETKSKPIPLDAQGVIHLNWLFYNKLVASNVDFQFTFQEGKLQVEPLSASFFGGALGASVKADVELPGPPLQYSIYTENVLLDEIVRAFWPATRGSWSGNVNQKSKASGIGSDLSALEAHTDLNINEAKLSEHPITKKLAELFQAEDLQHLRFSQVSARIRTSQGVATIRRLHLVGPILQAEGSGTAGLMDKKLDLNFHLQIPTQYVGKLASLREIVAKISDEHGYVQLPLNVSGTFDEPVYRFDERWLAEITKKAAEEPAKKLEQKVLPQKEKDKDKPMGELQKVVQ